MTDYPTWKNPPILEALLDIRVTLPSSVEAVALEAFSDGLEERFPLKMPLSTVQFGFEEQPGQPPALQVPISNTHGYRFQSADGHKVVQVHREGFTFSRVGSYETWADFSQEAHELWQRYLALAEPETVTRLGLRYINRIRIPMNGGPIDFKDYLLTTPEISPDVPQELVGFFMHLVIPSADRTSFANVIQMMESPISGTDLLPLIFDIDVFKPEAFQPRSEALWEAFGALRDFKNQIFYGSIKEKTKELFR